MRKQIRIKVKDKIERKGNKRWERVETKKQLRKRGRQVESQTSRGAVAVDFSFLIPRKEQKPVAAEKKTNRRFARQPQKQPAIAFMSCHDISLSHFLFSPPAKILPGFIEADATELFNSLTKSFRGNLFEKSTWYSTGSNTFVTAVYSPASWSPQLAVAPHNCLLTEILGRYGSSCVNAGAVSRRSALLENTAESYASEGSLPTLACENASWKKTCVHGTNLKIQTKKCDSR